MEPLITHMLLPGGSELSESAFGYFITACVVIVLAIVCYLALPRLVSRWKKPESRSGGGVGQSRAPDQWCSGTQA